MIAKSDLIILVISASALGLGLYRWQQNTAVPSSASLSAPPAAVTSPAATPGAPDPAPLTSNTASRPAEPRTEPLVGRPASEGVAAAPGPAAPESGGTNATGRNDGAVVRPQTAPADTGSVATAGTPLEALPGAPSGIPPESAPDTPSDAPFENAGPSAGTDPVAPTSADADGSELYGRYRVREGDYLGRIAERFGTSVATLRSINGIEGSLILVGQELRYPLPAN